KPRHGITARDADQAKDENDDDSEKLQVLEKTKIKDDGCADKDFENHQKLTLRQHVRLTGLVYQLGDFQHRRVHGHLPQLLVNKKPEKHSQSRDQQAEFQQRSTADAIQEGGLRHVGNDQVDFAAALFRRAVLRENRQGCRNNQKKSQAR